MFFIAFLFRLTNHLEGYKRSSYLLSLTENRQIGKSQAIAFELTIQ